MRRRMCFKIEKKGHYREVQKVASKLKCLETVFNYLGGLEEALLIEVVYLLSRYVAF